MTRRTRRAPDSRADRSPVREMIGAHHIHMLWIPLWTTTTGAVLHPSPTEAEHDAATARDAHEHASVQGLKIRDMRQRCDQLFFWLSHTMASSGYLRSMAFLRLSASAARVQGCGGAAENVQCSPVWSSVGWYWALKGTPVAMLLVRSASMALSEAQVGG